MFKSLKESESFVRTLVGHSGCILSLYRGDKGLFVRKIAGDDSYNRRLKLQCIKQKKTNTGQFLVPKVLNYGFESKRFFFDMEFINCLSLDKYIRTVRMGAIPGMVENLFKCLPIASSIYNGNAVSAVSRKLSELDQKIKIKTLNVIRAIDFIKCYDFSYVPESACHGDLTLENIMFTDDGKVYLIDFLDSFFNSWIIDIAKILQDVDLYWSYRYDLMDASLELRLLVVKEEIFRNILKLENGQQILKDVYYMLLLNVLRIFPYVKDEVTSSFLDNVLIKILQQIKELQ